MLNSFYTVFAVMFFTFLDYPNGVQVAVWLVLTDDVSECLWGLHYRNRRVALTRLKTSQLLCGCFMYLLMMGQSVCGAFTFYKNRGVV